MAQQQPIQLVMPGGEMVWAMVERQGPKDTGLGDQVAQRIEGFQESLHAVAANVRAAVATVRPDEVSVEFGLELAAGKHGVVAALTGVGGKATFKVALKWVAPGPAPAGTRQPDPPVVSPASPLRDEA
ncbi:CU044_2847 family protein [Streptomyces microflavus]|uniref:CU044_2847 family protein n=1 Tax=Streptomyces microflavus TaxID=1919 RepID=UPI002E30CD03|nr:CU044_2847 family protein [Streptomyces microflavus]